MRKVRLRTVLAVLVVIALIVIFALKAPAFDVSKYEVTGNHYYSDQEIANMGNCALGVNIFTGVDCGDIRDRLAKESRLQPSYTATVLWSSMKRERSSGRPPSILRSRCSED